MMSIGSHLRALYVDRLRFLSSQLKASDVYVRSTDYSRTIESVQYLLGGLYPAKTRSPKESLAIHIRLVLFAHV